MYNTIIGLFEDGTKASHAITALLNAGVPRDSIRAMSNDPNEKDVEAGGTGLFSSIKGFLADIGVLSEDTTHGVPEEHLKIYRDGISSGKTLIMVVADQTWSPRIVQLMESQGAVHVDDGSPDIASASPTLSTGDQPPHRRSAFEAYKGGVRVYPRSPQQNVSPSSQQGFSSTNSAQQHYQQAQAQQYQQTYPNASHGPTVQAVENQPGPVSDQARRIVETTKAQHPQGFSFETFEADFRSNYESVLSGTGYPWDYYAPAYHYGFDLGAAPGWPSEWGQVEPYARDQWERHNPNTWDRFQQAVRYSWQRARIALGSTTVASAQPVVRDSAPGR